jgi:hypothetical protein
MTTRRRADLEIAAARSAVAALDSCWRDIPDGDGSLQRARANLAAIERRYANLVEEPATPPVTVPWDEPPPPDPATLVGRARIALMEAKAKALDPQRCHICIRRHSPFSFSAPLQKPIWACAIHRAAVAALWEPAPYVPMPRAKQSPRR